MAWEPNYVVTGPEALKHWAEMSVEEREEARATWRYLDPNGPGPSAALVVLDGALPAKVVVSVVEDPANSDHQLIVVSRRTYSYAALHLAARAIFSSECKILLRRLGRLDLTAQGTVVSPDGRSLFEVETPDQRLFKETKSLTHKITVATSMESVDLPKLGRGEIYRSNG